MKLPENLLHHSLFADMTGEEAEQFLQCTGARVCHFEKEEQLTRSTDTAGRVGILLSGGIAMARDDAAGNRCILTNFLPGEVFGLSFAITGKRPEGSYLYAPAPSEALMMNGEKLMNGCDRYCSAHHLLYRNALHLMAEKNVELLRKQYHMAQKSLRKKLMSYLSEQAAIHASPRFRIGMNRQELADFLGVDRSALCSMLSKMQEEGLLSYRRNEFTLHEEMFRSDS